MESVQLLKTQYYFILNDRVFGEEVWGEGEGSQSKRNQGGKLLRYLNIGNVEPSLELWIYNHLYASLYSNA